MTSPSSTRNGSAAPGDRPHLPPVPTTSRRTDRKAPLGWLPWLLLGLLLLTLLLAALLTKAVGGDSGSGSASRSAEQSQDASAQGGAPAAGADAAGADTGAASGAALTAGGRDLLALPGGDIGSVVGQQAEGTARVQAVVADEGFWVGPSVENRVFVFLTPEARRSAGESGFQVEQGQTVQLAGSVKASSPEFAQSAGVDADEGAGQLARQGGYVEATEVSLAG